MSTPTWRKSSRSNSQGGACVEVTRLPGWRKSTRSNMSGGDCVEVAKLPGNIGLRDSKDPDGPQLSLTREAFKDLLGALKL